jgi:NAD(P)-dependent dehydrogenase (short-subunit alcohol dehydrogenase family)
MPSGDLANQRALYNEVYNTNLTSVGIITDAFKPLLYQSSNPRVISISSGLGSIQGALTKKMYRAPCYGSSKIGMNGLMVHMQVSENDRKENSQKFTASEEDVKPVIRFFCCAPGPLSTAFTGFHPMARPVETGTQVVVRLIFDDERKYEGGTYWEFEENEMRQVPW